MKIAYVSNTRYPSERAHSIQITHMCNAFVANGHTVHLFVTDRKTTILDTPEQYYGVPIQFVIQTLTVFDFVGRILLLPKFIWPLVFMFQRLMYIIMLLKRLKQLDSFDIVYGRDEWIMWMISIFLRKQKVVWESHEAKHNFATTQLLARKTPVVVISEGIKDAYVRRRYEASQFIIAHDAVDATFFSTFISRDEARKSLDLSVEETFVMYIGGLDKWKGVTTLFEASELLPTHIRVAVIGGKPHQISELSLQYPKVLFLGSRPYSELPQNQQAADVLVVPNTAKNKLSSEYTSPLKLFAHMTAKVPLVLSDIPSLRNVLQDTQAYFFEADNSKALGQKLEEVIAHKSEAMEKAQHAFLLSKKYTWSARAEAIVKGVIN